jgi:hypothetical protein
MGFYLSHRPTLSMWYFLIKQRTLEKNQFQVLQKQASVTEIVPFSEPYENCYVFSVEKETYQAFMDYLDTDGIIYSLVSSRPTRAELLAEMN